MLVAVGLNACGRAISPGDVASSVRTPSPTSSAVLQAGNCVGPQSGSPTATTKPLGLDSITLSIPTTWSDQTSQVTGAGALLYIQAPASYGPDHASFMLVSVPGPRQGSSSHAQALADAAGLAPLGPQSPVLDCTVGGQQASFYDYKNSAGRDVFNLLVLHDPTSKYPFLYRVVILSPASLDTQAIADIRAILGSWTWGTPVYDPNS